MEATNKFKAKTPKGSDEKKSKIIPPKKAAKIPKFLDAHPPLLKRRKERCRSLSKIFNRKRKIKTRLTLKERKWKKKLC